MKPFFILTVLCGVALLGGSCKDNEQEPSPHVQTCQLRVINITYRPMTVWIDTALDTIQVNSLEESPRRTQVTGSHKFGLVHNAPNISPQNFVLQEGVHYTAAITSGIPGDFGITLITDNAVSTDSTLLRSCEFWYGGPYLQIGFDHCRALFDSVQTKITDYFAIPCWGGLTVSDMRFGEVFFSLPDSLFWRQTSYSLYSVNMAEGNFTHFLLVRDTP